MMWRILRYSQPFHLGILITSCSASSSCQSSIVPPGGSTPIPAYGKESSPDDGSPPDPFSYVIVGCGVSGRSALLELLKHKRIGERVLVVDPHRGPVDDSLLSAITTTGGTGTVVHRKSYVEMLDHRRKLLRLDDGSQIVFDKCLISVGSASVPIRTSYLESDAVHVSRCIVDLHDRLATEQLHAIVRDGGHVTIIGANCFSAVELAARLSRTSHLSTRAGSQVTLLFPAFGPLASVLPRYLSQAYLKRLSAMGVKILPYSQLRYVGSNSQSNADNSSEEIRAAGRHAAAVIRDEVLVFAVKSYDALSTQSFATNRLVFVQSSVPSVVDRALPSAEHYVDPSTTPFYRPLQYAHDFIVRSGLELDSLNGGIMVNQALEACMGIYVSGDVASIYSTYHHRGLDGVGSTDGAVRHRGVYRGWDHAVTTGTLAGYNMTHASSSTKLLSDYVPVYEGNCSIGGLYVTQIGLCSSALESHGYWFKVEDRRGDRGGKSTAMNFDTSPPLGLGVVFYVHSDRVVGVLISGLPSISHAVASRDPSGGSPDDRRSSYSHLVNHIAKSLIGASIYSLSQYSLSVTARRNMSDASEQLNSSTQVLMGLSNAASKIISPVLSPSLYENVQVVDASREEALTGNLLETISSYPRPLYRFGPQSAATVKELEDSVRKSGSVRPFIGREAVFQTGMDGSGSSADKISAAYRKGILRGPHQ